MKSALALSLALVAAMVASPAMAEDGSVPQVTLQGLGLSGMELMSDEEGHEIRGRLSGQAMVAGTSLISFQLVTPDTKNFINGSSINMVSGTAQFSLAGEQLTKSHAVAINPPVTLNVAVTNQAVGNFNYLGSVVGTVGGAGFIRLGP